MPTILGVVKTPSAIKLINIQAFNKRISEYAFTSHLVTEVSLWWTPSFLRNSLVLPAVYSGPPSDVSVLGIPKPWKHCPRREIRL